MGLGAKGDIQQVGQLYKAGIIKFIFLDMINYSIKGIFFEKCIGNALNIFLLAVTVFYVFV
ncbi:hypothetical protein G293_03905 [Candidatus Liberibacter africanus PTSAPSY]|uniref:Uncharacterized protein n=1 Tax=Candidatus Liberibacter africanus PTSAPSY TaxID=1277257 RepID=A0A0G3I5A4_LIBAF|nr:hypothetical protein G293_03905 [Candidatus Liberibacter africanus PTSAPSY]